MGQITRLVNAVHQSVCACGQLAYQEAEVGCGAKLRGTGAAGSRGGALVGIWLQSPQKSNSRT